MQRIHLAVIGLLLAGCATSMDIGLPDGSTGYALNCSGQSAWGASWGACMKRAAELCKGRGYDVLMRDERTGRVATLTATQFGLVGSSAPTTDREMIVRCK